MATSVLLQLADLFSREMWLIFSVAAGVAASLCIFARYGFRDIAVLLSLCVIANSLIGCVGLIINICIVAWVGIWAFVKFLDRGISHLELEKTFQDGAHRANSQKRSEPQSNTDI